MLLRWLLRSLWCHCMHPVPTRFLHPVRRCLKLLALRRWNICTRRFEQLYALSDLDFLYGPSGGMLSRRTVCGLRRYCLHSVSGRDVRSFGRSWLQQLPGRHLPESRGLSQLHALLKWHLLVPRICGLLLGWLELEPEYQRRTGRLCPMPGQHVRLDGVPGLRALSSQHVGRQRLDRLLLLPLQQAVLTPVLL